MLYLDNTHYTSEPSGYFSTLILANLLPMRRFSVLQHALMVGIATYGYDVYGVLFEISTAPRQEYSCTIDKKNSTPTNLFPLILKPLPFLTRKIGTIDIQRASNVTTVTYNPILQDDIYKGKEFHSFDSAMGYFASKVHAPVIQSKITSHPTHFFTTQQSTTYQWNICDSILTQKVELSVTPNKPGSTKGKAQYTTDVKGMAKLEMNEPLHANFWVFLDLLLHHKANIEALEKHSSVRVRSLLTHSGYPCAYIEEDWKIGSIDTRSSTTSIKINLHTDKTKKKQSVVVQHKLPPLSTPLSLEEITSIELYRDEKHYITLTPIAPTQLAVPAGTQAPGDEQMEVDQPEGNDMDTS